MLKQRILTGLLLVGIMLAAVFYMPVYGFALALGSFVAAAAWEWSKLAGLHTTAWRLLYVVFMSCIGALLIYLQQSGLLPPIYVAIIGTLWWLAVSLDLLLSRGKSSFFLSTTKTKLVSGWFVLMPAWVSATPMKAADINAPLWLLLLFSIVVFADSAAFFTGKAFGHHKLAPFISPGKSIEGAIGGTVAAIILALVFGFAVWDFSLFLILILILLTVLTVIFSIVGDLFESKLKRMAGAKDSGSILPGHGGVLDRIDAFVAATPVFASAWIIMGSRT